MFSRAIQRLSEIHSKPKISKTRHFLAYQEFPCKIFLQHFLDISLNHFALFIVVKVNSEYSQISRSVMNFQGKTYFQGVSSAREKAFQISALFKELKELDES